MKKWIAMLLAVLTAVSLTACAAKSGRFESPAKKDPEAIGFGVFRTGSYFA